MKHIPLLLFFITLIIYLGCKETPHTITPRPTQVFEGQEEGDGSSKEAWFDDLHSAAPDVDWKAIELANQRDIAAYKSALREASSLRDDIEIGPGVLSGTWKERGSDNQAGSILRTTYDKRTDNIYAISAGGTLWRGALEGDNWKVLNQDIRFGRFLLEVVYDENDERTVITDIGGDVHYSLDEGMTWKPTNLKNLFISHSAISADGSIFILAKSGFASNINLYKSSDAGKSFSSVHVFKTNETTLVDFTYDPAYDEIFAIEVDQVKRKGSLLHYNKSSNSLDLTQDTLTADYKETAANLTSKVIDGIRQFYIYNRDNEVYMTRDTGLSWEFVDLLQEAPWSVGLYATNYDTTQTVLMGAVECFRLGTNGKFNKINNWYDYYGDVEYMLHADIMYIEEYLDQEEKPFILISNHGGISKSYDLGLINKNISLKTLNVGQFYDVRSLPGDTDFIFGGTQDQGLQRGTGDPDEILSLEQVISGDYGHIVFTNKSNHMATVYPYGSISYYTSPKTGYASFWYAIPNPGSLPWIPPVEASPHNEDAIYMAGGTEKQDGGSRLMKLTNYAGSYDVEEFDHNFSGPNETISAIGFNYFNPDKIYVATRRGKFFISENGGDLFTQSDNGLPGAHYLYGSCILTSKVDSNLIYLSGSGYTNSPVYRSLDGGQSFQSYSGGLPSTTVFNIVSNNDETILYAATEAGPFVRHIDDNEWVYLGGTDAPNTRFWSVEYVEDKDIARFGTYGRGIWDFQVTQQPVSTQDESFDKQLFSIYPNPAKDKINIRIGDEITIKQVDIHDNNGALIKSYQNIGNGLYINELKSGIYFVTLHTGNSKSTRKLIKI